MFFCRSMWMPSCVHWWHLLFATCCHRGCAVMLQDAHNAERSHLCVRAGASRTLAQHSSWNQIWQQVSTCFILNNTTLNGWCQQYTRNFSVDQIKGIFTNQRLCRVQWFVWDMMSKPIYWNSYCWLWFLEILICLSQTTFSL